MEHGRIADPAVFESSGIAVSRRFEGVFWTHNDDGPPTLFAVDLDGRRIRSFGLPVPNYDWEDIALDQQRNLYLLDNTSKNDSRHQTLIHVLPEPDPFTQDHVDSVETFGVRYVDEGQDTECLFVWDAEVFLITKPWDGSAPRIYVADKMKNSVAALVGELSGETKAMITGGDISEDGQLVALCSYRAIFIFEIGSDLKESLLRNPLVCRMNAGQIEGISWKGRDLILTNEQGSIYWVKEAEWRLQEAPFQTFPHEEIPYYSPGELKDVLPVDWESGTWLNGDELERMGRVAWSESGLHVGIQVPGHLVVPPLDREEPEDLDHWFTPGRIYVLINPKGDRRLSFGSNDRCVVVGSESGDVMNCEERTLLPATYIQSKTVAPPWIKVERAGQWVLVTLTRHGPGLEQLRAGKKMGFNLVIIEENGTTLSWAPLMLDFSWDAPSFWGLIELVD
jgi:hypothetical protein